MSRIKHWKNWWYYNKWYVAGSLLLVIFLIRWVGNAFGWFRKAPDLQIAFIGSRPLPADTASSIEKAFGELAGDVKGSAALAVLNQYPAHPAEASDDALRYGYAQEIRLIGDIEGGDSFLYLMENPDQVQREFQILADDDGRLPEDTDIAGSDLCVRAADCSLLSDLLSETYQETIAGTQSHGTNADFLSGLWLGHRWYSDDPLASEHEELWNRLTSSCTS